MDIGTWVALLLAAAAAAGTFFRSKRDTSLRKALAEEIAIETDLRKRCQERLTTLESHVRALTETVTGAAAVGALTEMVERQFTEILKRLDLLHRRKK